MKRKFLRKTMVAVMALAMVLATIPFSMMTAFAAPSITVSDVTLVESVGYTVATAKSGIVTVENTGTDPVSLMNPESTENITAGALDKTTLNAGEKATFSVKPAKEFGLGKYVDKIILKTNTGDELASTTVNLSVTNPLKVTVAPETQNGVAGGTVKFVATVEGGNPGGYTYNWYAMDDLTTSLSTKKSLSIKPTETKEYKVVVSDGFSTAEATAKVTVVDGISVSGSGYFADRNMGYTTAPDANSFELENLGTNQIELAAGTLKNFDIVGLPATGSTTTIPGKGKLNFTIRPKTGLPVGTYKESLTLSTTNGGSAVVEVEFKVNDVLFVTASPDNVKLFNGDTTTAKLKANVSGGSGVYSFKWYRVGDPLSTVISTESEIDVRPAETSDYKVVVSDGIDEKIAICTVYILDKTYQIYSTVIERDFGVEKIGYTKAPEAVEIAIKNDGNQNVTLKAPSAIDYYNIKDFIAKTLAPGEEMKFTVQPMVGLPKGTYNKSFTVRTAEGQKVVIKFKFTVDEKGGVPPTPPTPGISSLKINPAAATITQGSSQKLTAEVEGGSGKFTYAWYVGSGASKALISGANSKEYAPSPITTTTYTVVVTDTVSAEVREASATITVNPASGGGGGGGYIPIPITPTPTPVTPAPTTPTQTATEKIIAGVESTTIKVRSFPTSGGIVLNWVKSAGYRVDYYEVFRSTKQYSGYDTTPFFTTKNGNRNSYTNTKNLKEGKCYYYKLRGVRIIDGKKYYTSWSNKAFRVYRNGRSRR